MAKAPHHHGVETAGHLAIAPFPTAVETEEVEVTLKRMASSSFGAPDLLVVTDQAGRYRGAVELIQLLQAPAKRRVGELMRPGWPRIAPDIDQEHAVLITAKAKVAALPVVNNDERPIGVIPPLTLLEVLAHEHREDMHRLVGILREQAGSRHALEDPRYGVLPGGFHGCWSGLQ